MSMLITYTLMSLTSTVAQAGAAELTPKATEMMAALDKDKDGYISLKEAVGDAQLLETFGAIDADQDGKLSADELLASLTVVAEKTLKAVTEDSQ